MFRAFILAAAVAALCLFAEPTAANAQVLNFGNHRAELRGSQWHSETSPVHRSAVARLHRDGKLPALLAAGQRQLRATSAQLTSRGCTLVTQVDVFQPGIRQPARLTGNLTLVEVRFAGTTKTGAIGFFFVSELPNVAFPRLFTKEFSHDSLVSERSLRNNGQVTLMAARHCDCIFRSSEQILANRNSAVHRVLRARIEVLRPASTIDTLTSLYGPAGQGFGGPHLALVSTLVIPANYEEEFAPMWVEGQINGLGPNRTDPPAVAFLKNALKEALKQLAKEAGKWLASYFGL